MSASIATSCAGSRLHYRNHRSQALVSARRPVPTAVRSLAHSSQFHLTTWDSSKETSIALRETVTASASSSTAGSSPKRQIVRMGNKATGGPFSPLVVVVRSALGEKEFNKIRGKAISAHSQVIKEFCKVVGVDQKQCQGVIRLAKKNGEWLGFLA